MPRKVTTSPEAAAGFKGARRWLLQPGSGQDGRVKWERLKQARRDLRVSPCMGGTADPEHNGLRRRAVAGFRLIYRVEPDTNSNETAGDMRVLALFGPGQR